MSNLPAKSTGLPAKASGGKLPAIATKPSGRLRPFDRYAENAQRVLEFFVHFDSLLSKIKSCSDLEHVERMLQICDERYREMVAQCERDRQSFEPANAYDEDGYIKEEMVSMHIATLLASYPNSNASDPEAYLVMMVEEVMAVYPKLTVLDSACRQVRRKSKFPPVTSEVLAAIKEQEDIWDNRWNAMESLEITAEELREALPVERERRAQAKRKEEERLAIVVEQERVKDELRAKPLVVGDRVKWSHRNSGGVIADVLTQVDCADVVFDDAVRQRCCIPDLARLLPGEWLYTPNEYEAKKNRKLRPVVGDRVIDSTEDEFEDQLNGPGTLIDQTVVDGFDFTVQFDNGVLGKNWRAEDLGRLLHGDPNFERPESAVAGWQQWESNQAAAELERQRLLPPLNIGDRVFNTQAKLFGNIAGMSDQPGRFRDVRGDGGFTSRVNREHLELRDPNDGRPSPGFDPNYPIDPCDDDEPDLNLGLFSPRHCRADR